MNQWLHDAWVQSQISSCPVDTEIPKGTSTLDKGFLLLLVFVVIGTAIGIS